MLAIIRTGLLGSRLGVGFTISPLETGLRLMDSFVISLEVTAIALDCPSITPVIVIIGRHSLLKHSFNPLIIWLCGLLWDGLVIHSSKLPS